MMFVKGTIAAHFEEVVLPLYVVGRQVVFLLFVVSNFALTVLCASLNHVLQVRFVR